MIGRTGPQDPTFRPWKRMPRTKSHCELELGHKNIYIHWWRTSIYEIAINLGYISISYFFIGPFFFQRNQHVSNMTFFCTGAWPNQLSWCRARSVRFRASRCVAWIWGFWGGESRGFSKSLGRDFHHEKVGSEKVDVTDKWWLVHYSMGGFAVILVTIQ